MCFAGIEGLLDDALREGACLSVVAGTTSAPEDGIIDAAMAELGPERAAKVRVFSISGPGDREEGDESGEPTQLTFEQSMQLAQAKVSHVA
jgi:hypothetical protein